MRLLPKFVAGLFGPIAAFVRRLHDAYLGLRSSGAHEGDRARDAGGARATARARRLGMAAQDTGADRRRPDGQYQRITVSRPEQTVGPLPLCDSMRIGGLKLWKRMLTINSPH